MGCDGWAAFDPKTMFNCVSLISVKQPIAASFKTKRIMMKEGILFSKDPATPQQKTEG